MAGSIMTVKTIHCALKFGAHSTNKDSLVIALRYDIHSYNEPERPWLSLLRTRCTLMVKLGLYYIGSCCRRCFLQELEI